MWKETTNVRYIVKKSQLNSSYLNLIWLDYTPKKDGYDTYHSTLYPEFCVDTLKCWTILGLFVILSRQALKNNYESCVVDCTSLASITVPTPTVRAIVGTLVMSLSKNRALATMVSFAKDLTRVLETNDEPGSLNAIWPSLPIPVKVVKARHGLVKHGQRIIKQSFMSCSIYLGSVGAWGNKKLEE